MNSDYRAELTPRSGGGWEISVKDGSTSRPADIAARLDLKASFVRDWRVTERGARRAARRMLRIVQTAHQDKYGRQSKTITLDKP